MNEVRIGGTATIFAGKEEKRNERLLNESSFRCTKFLSIFVLLSNIFGFSIADQNSLSTPLGGEFCWDEEEESRAEANFCAVSS